MGSDFWIRVSVFIAFLIVTDTLLFFGFRRMLFRKTPKKRYRQRFTIAYFLFILLFILYAILHFLILKYGTYDYYSYRDYFFITAAFILIYVPKAVMLVFVLTENIVLFFIQFISFIFQNRRHYEFVRRIKRFKLISWIGFITGTATFIFLLYSMLVTRTDFKLVNQTVVFKNLPASFDGTKIILISDAHLGSFFNANEIDPAFKIIQSQSPDLIVFTGDMINVSPDETLPYIQKFKDLKAPLGKFSILGNHDLGDYLKLSDVGDQKNIEAQLAQHEQEMGFKVLRNDHVFLHKGQDSIALIGIDSWGLSPFKQFGNIGIALKEIDNRTFKILLSHISSQWDLEVKGITNIDITFAGHTHAAQFGINNFGIHWSPVSWKYKYWMGLYQWGNQFLYVNPGMGYLGFPGRIGIQPEITLITLKKD
jgi:uncharacterized protein